MARYELTTPHFIEPEFYKAGTVIDYDGEPTPSMRPLDDEAEKKLAAYFKLKPGASINPVEQLPRTMATVVIEEPLAPAIPKVVAKVGGK